MTIWLWRAVCAGEVLSGRRWHTGSEGELTGELHTEVRWAFGRNAKATDSRDVDDVEVSVWPLTEGSPDAPHLHHAS